jgi:hypothetical protein
VTPLAGMSKRALIPIFAVLVGSTHAAPPSPSQGDLHGWELPRLESIDTIDFPRRLVRNRSYGRVVAEVHLLRDGTRQDIDFTFVENGDLVRWAEKILRSAKFSPARLDGSPRAARLPVHLLFIPAQDGRPARYEFWLPTDSAYYQPCLHAHFLYVNETLPPLLLRVGSYDRVTGSEDGVVAFEVYVQKDGSREQGRLITAPGDETARQALTALVEMQILPARFRTKSYGSWTRVAVGFCPDWSFPTRTIDRSIVSYRGWPAPVVLPVAATFMIPPQFRRVATDSAGYDAGILQRATELIFGHAIFGARVDTNGSVAEWFRVRPADPEALATDWEYLSYVTRLSERSGVSLASISLPELARIAATEMEKIMSHLRFSPARDERGHKIDAWIAVTPAIFR